MEGDHDYSAFTSLYVGAMPAASMLGMSWLIVFNALPNFGGLSSADVETYTQSFCGGMILAAVASELYPILETSSFMGVSVGICVGLLVIYLLAVQDELFEEGGGDGEDESNEKEGRRSRGQSFGKSAKDEKKNLMTSGGKEYNSLEDIEFGENVGLSLGDGEVQQQKHEDNSDGRSSPITSAHSDVESGVDIDIDGVGNHADHWAISNDTLATQAVTLSNSVETKAQVRQKLRNMHQLVSSMNEKSIQLVNMTVVNYATREMSRTNSMGLKKSSSGLHLSPSAEKLSIEAAERLADSLDEDVHRLQYFVDHCRRLVEGPAAIAAVAAGGQPATELISVNRSKHLESGVKDMLSSAELILDTFERGSPAESSRAVREHEDEHVVSPEALKIIYRQLRSMDRRLTSLHSTVDRATYRYKRRSLKMGPIPMKGSTIPLSLVVPVIVDCAVDGFLIGLSCALSDRAGLILALVTCFEMGALGVAFSLRIRKCSGNSQSLRRIIITVPPLLMLCMCFIGARSGSGASTHPVTMGVCVGFGVTALLQLACVELLGEAFRSEEVAGIGAYASMFGGVWLVMLLDRVVS